MERWHTWWSRLLELARTPRVERDIDDEVRFHIEEEIEAGMRRGMTEQEARSAAHQSLGGMPNVVREQLRDIRQVSRVDDLRRDLRHGIRLLRRNPAFASVVIGTLAVAIGAAVTAFSITDAWLFRPLPFPNADRLTVAFAATATRPTEPAVWMPYRAYLAFRGSVRTFSSIAGAALQQATWRTPSTARSVVGMRVTPEFFSTFGVQALRGRTLSARDASDSPVVVLSYAFWQRELGGDEGVIDSALTLSANVYTVVGVMPATFDVRLLDQPEGAAFWTPLRTGERGYEPGGIGPLAIVGRLRHDVTIEAARAELTALLRDSEAAYPFNFATSFVTNLTSLQADNTRTVRATLLTVLAATLCLLLIASMNVGGLLLGRGLRRRGEVAVRHALGAGRGRLVRQFLAESLVLSVCGGGLGLALAVVGTRLFVAWNPLGTLPTNVAQVDFRVLAVVLLTIVVTTIVAGVVPAMRMSAVGPASTLRIDEGVRTTAPAHHALRGMLVGQMAISTVLLVCAALLARTFVQLRAEPLGFESEDVTVATVVLPMASFNSGPSRQVFYSQLEERLNARPGVRAVAAATAPPLVAGAPMTVNLTGLDEPAARRIGTQDVSAGFFDALEIPLIAGRAFDSRDHVRSEPVVIVNARAAADLFGDPDRALGQRIRLDQEPWREIIGVVGNVRTTFFNTLEWRTEPILYRPAAQGFSRVAPMAASFTLWVHVRSTRPISAAEVRDAAFAVTRDAAMTELHPVRHLVAVATRQPTLRMALLVWLCGASLLLAAIGVHALVTQAVAERLREIAIKIALGAHPRRVVTTYVRSALLTGVAGLALGAVLAMMLAQVLETLLYGVRPGDTAALAAVVLLLLAVVGCAASLPALRAVRGEVAQILRA
jgi:predicted permease